MVHRCRTLKQVIRNVTDSIQLGVTRPATGLKVRELRNRSRSKYADAQQACLFHRNPLVCSVVDSPVTEQCGSWLVVGVEFKQGGEDRGSRANGAVCLRRI